MGAKMCVEHREGLLVNSVCSVRERRTKEGVTSALGEVVPFLEKGDLGARYLLSFVSVE